MSYMKEQLIGDVDEVFNKLYPKYKYNPLLTVALLKIEMGKSKEEVELKDLNKFVYGEPGVDYEYLNEIYTSEKLWFAIQDIMTGEL